MANEKLTEHFALVEFTRSLAAQALGVDNTPSVVAVANLKRLCVDVLEPLRVYYGKPIRVTSGYRCPEVNEAVGGEFASQHLSGCAADIVAWNGSTADNRMLFEHIVCCLSFDQCIWEKGGRYIHVSYKADGSNRHQVIGQPEPQV